MCDPITIAIGLGAIGVGGEIFGGITGANAAKKQKAAIIEENRAKTEAQNKGFASRLAATDARTDAQIEAQTGTLAEMTGAAEAMGQGQHVAREGREKTLGALNDQEDYLRSIGYASADELMDKTSREKLEGSQTDWQEQARTLLDASGVPALSGATEAGGTGDDPFTKAALIRRAAEAAANIRAYGGKTAKVNSYQAPLFTAANAIRDSETGIMPAQMASKLLQTSAPVLLQPSEVAYDNASGFGKSAMNVAQQRGNTALGVAGLQYKNSTDIADLAQANAGVRAGNISTQAIMDAKYQEAMAGIYSGIGGLALQGAGYYGELPGFLDKFPKTAALPKGPVGDFGNVRSFA